MPLSTEETTAIVKEFGKSETDTGSSAVQVALLTARIKQLAEHMRDHKLDMHNRRGLVQMVAKRNRLLRYLRNTDNETYRNTIKALGLRK